jgi:WD40 repeat protein
MTVCDEIDRRMTHSETVTGLTWRPGCRKGIWELASSGDDCSVRIYQVSLETNSFTKTS